MWAITQSIIKVYESFRSKTKYREQMDYFISIYRFKINLKNKKDCKIVGSMKKTASNNKQIQKDIKNHCILSSFWNLTTLKWWMQFLHYSLQRKWSLLQVDHHCIYNHWEQSKTVLRGHSILFYCYVQSCIFKSWWRATRGSKSMQLDFCIIIPVDASVTFF